MGLLHKTVSDKEWLDQVMPLYRAALAQTSALADAVRCGSLSDQLDAVPELLLNLPVIAKGIAGLPSPTSPEARQAKRELQLALKDFVDGAKAGQKLGRALAGGLAERVGWGGISGRAAAGRAGFQIVFF